MSPIMTPSIMGYKPATLLNNMLNGLFTSTGLCHGISIEMVSMCFLLSIHFCICLLRLAPFVLAPGISLPQRAASDTVSSRILRCSTRCKWDLAPKDWWLHGATMWGPPVMNLFINHMNYNCCRMHSILTISVKHFDLLQLSDLL